MLVYDKDAIIEVTKEFTFDSCHQLLGYEGACKRLHGHTYKLQVTFRGTVNEIGMVIDFNEIKETVKAFLLDDLDHYNLNEKLPFNTTAENMVVWIYDFLSHECNTDFVKVSCVTLWETPTSYATYRGESVCSL